MMAVVERLYAAPILFGARKDLALESGNEHAAPIGFCPSAPNERAFSCRRRRLLFLRQNLLAEYTVSVRAWFLGGKPIFGAPRFKIHCLYPSTSTAHEITVLVVY